MGGHYGSEAYLGFFLGWVAKNGKCNLFSQLHYLDPAPNEQIYEVNTIDYLRATGLLNVLPLTEQVTSASELFELSVQMARDYLLGYSELTAL